MFSTAIMIIEHHRIYLMRQICALLFYTSMPHSAVKVKTLPLTNSFAMFNKRAAFSDFMLLKEV
jgi:hypothetical protein